MNIPGFSDLCGRSLRRLKMEVLVAVGAWALSSVCGTLSHDSRMSSLLCPQGLPYYDLSPLEPLLSATASVIYPNETTAFDLATARWSSYETPTISVVVVPGTESDVAEIVKFATECNIPFLAVNGGHGAISTVGRMESGIAIWMHQLQTVEIAEDGKTATLGGGALSTNVTQALWAAGKQTVTGACECTSILGPGLGGGHGWLQGRHGLVSDQFVSMNIVLADGTLQTIDNTSDLWWAMQGAGHNFGIVTSVTVKIYDIDYPTWAYKSYIFTGDKFSDVYNNVNEYISKNGTQPVDIANYAFLYNDPTTSDKPLLMFYILQEGVTTVSSEYTAPFDVLGPTTTDAASGSYTEIPIWTAMSLDDIVCQDAGTAGLRFPIDLLVYNVTALQNAYDLFAAATQETPALNGSIFLFEGYSLQGVQSVPHESTAVSYRGDRLLVAPVLVFEPDGGALDAKAISVGEDIRNAIREGTGRDEFHAYVNYAFGTETNQEMYGYEQWRQDKLSALKEKYDPNRRFNFYAPIA
ncbi:hypothetical protein J7T55_015291 [Diaporthe amygdali]|uniref:uncharacterized protein n=1 Tax=Phomopsis amygdali TaxID=1214568 RepID=UPI0022FE00CB|nr:uncharacterized protein J7T55_015291 [Diaporthe amygdali]KAJ0120562.1 hypothetical protein J7T55_015291 [Diaporthe amygdali]